MFLGGQFHRNFHFNSTASITITSRSLLAVEVGMNNLRHGCAVSSTEMQPPGCFAVRQRPAATGLFTGRRAILGPLSAYFVM